MTFHYCHVHGQHTGAQCAACYGFSQITFPVSIPGGGYIPAGTVPANAEPVTFTFVPTATQAELDALKLRVAALEARLAALEPTE